MVSIAKVSLCNRHGHCFDNTGGQYGFVGRALLTQAAQTLGSKVPRSLDMCHGKSQTAASL